MTSTQGPAQKASLSDYLAAERTLLAWIRTGLALMGFGFVVARFGLFLQQLQLAQNRFSENSTGLSLWFGTALIAAGVTVSLSAGYHHIRLIRELDEGSVARPHPASLAVLTAVFLALVGVGMTIYLLSIHNSTRVGAKTMQEESMTIMNDTKMVNTRSRYSVDETVDRLKHLLDAKGVTLFALVDHSGEAEKVGMHMRPTKLLIFGSPRAGTPVMLAAPTSAIDLPLKVLIWENSEGDVLVSYNSPEYLAQRHGIPSELTQNLTAVKIFAQTAAE
jgi:uncharacterized protein (DUF302 family)/uncharacterized membrane protein YidH (DUF202 family)